MIQGTSTRAFEARPLGLLYLPYEWSKFKTLNVIFTRHTIFEKCVWRTLGLKTRSRFFPRTVSIVALRRHQKIKAGKRETNRSMFVPHATSLPFFQIISSIVGLPGGSFAFMMDKATILPTRQRTSPKYQEHLIWIVGSTFKEGMNNDKWALAVGYSGLALLKEYPDAREDQGDEDPNFKKRK